MTVSTAALVPRQIVEHGSRSGATRTSILDAAIAVFARSGFEAASTRDIAAAAGVHQASIRYHFADKETLWRSAITSMFERQRDEFRLENRDQPVDARSVEGVREMVRRYIRYSAAHPEHARILVHEAIADTNRLDWAVDQFVRANAIGMVERFGQPQVGVALRLADPRMSAIILSAASQMIFVLSSHLRRVFAIDVNEPAFVDRLVDALVALIFVDDRSD